jgi:FkbM family methyltransferase
MKVVLSALRAWIRMCQTQRSDIPALVKVGLTLLMLPAFAMLLVILRTASAFGARFTFEGRTTQGDRFICHPPDLIQLYLWLFDIWEPDLTDFIIKRLEPGDGFVDVGANIGYYSALASRRVGAHGHVVAIEASPEVFRDLQESIARNPHCQNVRLVNKAAAAVAGELNIYSGPKHNTGLTTTVRGRGFPAQTTIPAQPLDDLLSAEVIRTARLVKIDVEGGEPSVLAGMRRFITNCRPDLEMLIELSPSWWSDASLRPIDVLQPFMDAGFYVYEMSNSYWPWRYLWPNRVDRPRRTGRDLTKRVNRIDVVLSKRDEPEL